MRFRISEEGLKRLKTDIAAANFPAEIKWTEVGNYFFVSISRWGTSYLKFSITYPLYEKDPLDILLVSEDIAFLHKAYILDIKNLIKNMIIQHGGVVVL